MTPRVPRLGLTIIAVVGTVLVVAILLGTHPQKAHAAWGQTKHIAWQIWDVPEDWIDSLGHSIKQELKGKLKPTPTPVSSLAATKAANDKKIADAQATATQQAIAAQQTATYDAQQAKGAKATKAAELHDQQTIAAQQTEIAKLQATNTPAETPTESSLPSQLETAAAQTTVPAKTPTPTEIPPAPTNTPTPKSTPTPTPKPKQVGVVAQGWRVTNADRTKPVSGSQTFGVLAFNDQLIKPLYVGDNGSIAFALDTVPDMPAGFGVVAFTSPNWDPDGGVAIYPVEEVNHRLVLLDPRANKPGKRLNPDNVVRISTNTIQGQHGQIFGWGCPKALGPTCPTMVIKALRMEHVGQALPCTWGTWHPKSDKRYRMYYRAADRIAIGQASVDNDAQLGDGWNCVTPGKNPRSYFVTADGANPVWESETVTIVAPSPTVTPTLPAAPTMPPAPTQPPAPPTPTVVEAPTEAPAAPIEPPAPTQPPAQQVIAPTVESGSTSGGTGQTVNGCADEPNCQDVGDDGGNISPQSTAEAPAG